MPTNLKHLFLVDGILVEAVRSQGGGFYDLVVVSTGDKQRYSAKAFEAVAKPIKVSDDEFATPK